MDADTRDCAERRAAGQTMTVEVRTPMPKASDDITRDLVSIGEGINAVRLIVQVIDADDDYERYLAEHWCPPDDPD